ncbi:MAG: ABC transporter ATP-binding protein [Lachnospiraceae bacterium]|nr:ABC transporter ATP-binding protein [Lachnospiraceae bacterium]
MIILKILLTLYFGSTDSFAILFQLLMILGTWKLLEKSGVDKRWALVPCFRYYMLGKCADRELEGRVIAVNMAMSTIFTLLALLIRQDPWHSLFLVTTFVLVIVSFIYEIRLYSGLIEIYGVSRCWILVWIFAEWVAACWWGFSPRYQPRLKVDELHRESLTIFSGNKARELGQGLTVNLEERTATEFFKKKYLLRDIHLNIPPGRMVLLLGGSGAGKTTFVNAVNGYEKARAKVTLNGTDIYLEYKKMQYEIGFVPQQELMRSKDTVYRTLADMASLRLPTNLTPEDEKKRIQDVMEIFGLVPLKDSLVEKLSGGQKKRLSIAMELLSNPDLFILDEPDSGLDGVMARELMEELRKVADQGKIVIVITHTPDRVIDLFDDVIVLAKDSGRTGRLAFYGTIDEARKFFGKQTMEEIVRTINRKEEGGEGKADEYIARFVEVQNA